MYCPDIFRDNCEIKQRVIMYLSHGHRYKFMDIDKAVRIKCPDLFSTYHYCFNSKVLLHLTNSKGERIYNVAPLKTEGFLDAMCGYVLPVHSPSIIYNVCKIPFLYYEKQKTKKSKKSNDYKKEI